MALFDERCTKPEESKHLDIQQAAALSRSGPEATDLIEVGGYLNLPPPKKKGIFHGSVH
jgi:hypothetical protein